jgi:hypothetical protein
VNVLFRQTDTVADPDHGPYEVVHACPTTLLTMTTDGSEGTSDALSGMGGFPTTTTADDAG